MGYVTFPFEKFVSCITTEYDVQADSVLALYIEIGKYLRDNPIVSGLTVKEIIDKYLDENPPASNVISVNGKTGVVTGLYDYDNPPPYPVTSVNGKTGDVVIEEGGSVSGVTSVNGKTGAVLLKTVDVSNGNSSDENAYIFIDESDNYPDVVATDSMKLGGKVPEYYLHRRNLLDNSDFTNLVAQAGIGGKHGTVDYAADRWILTSGTVSYSEGTGLTLNGTITQKLENAPNVAYPYIGMASGAASISYEDGAVSITSSGGVIKWAAIYTTEYTADTLPPYMHKGYAAELAECLRYYWRLDFTGAPTLGTGWSYGTNTRISLTLPMPMKKTPMLSCDPVSAVQVISNNQTHQATSVSIHSYTNGIVTLNIAAETGVTGWGFASTRLNGVMTLEFSADV